MSHRLVSRLRRCGAPAAGPLRPAISQLDSLATTVPLNLTPLPLNNRHRPKRRSLERSRILGINLKERNERPEIRYLKAMAVLASTQLIVGVIVTSVSYYTSTVSPSVKTRDKPYWAGVPLIISGLVGIFFIARYKRVRTNTVSAFTFKVLSFATTTVSIVVSVCAVIFLTLHLVTFTHFKDCVTEESQDDKGVTSVLCSCEQEAGQYDRLHVYEQVACTDINLFKFLFIVMSIVLCIAVIDCFIYTLVLWSSRYANIYSGVASDDSTMPP